MLFRVTEHYADDLIENIIVNNSKVHEDECFICLSVEEDNEICPIKLEGNSIYTRECTCKGFVHKICLAKWYAINKKCPICRLYMTKRIYSVAESSARRIFGMNVFCVFIVRNICTIFLMLSTVIVITVQVLLLYTAIQSQLV